MTDNAEEAERTTLKVETPTHFGVKEVWILNLIGAIPGLLMGLLAAGGTVAAVAGAVFLFVSPWAVPSLVLSLILGIVALVVAGIMIYFMPMLVLGNWYVWGIVKRLGLPVSSHVDTCACQISFQPRLFTGLRALLEDADDIGVLRVEHDRLAFTGDHVTLEIPYAAIQSVQTHNIGWRGLWASGKRIRIVPSSVTRYQSFEVAERSSRTLVGSRRISRQLASNLAEKLEKSPTDAA